MQPCSRTVNMEEYLREILNGEKSSSAMQGRKVEKTSCVNEVIIQKHIIIMPSLQVLNKANFFL